jgi:photosystem II stability/assembly factor-like uncharacterized protein
MVDVTTYLSPNGQNVTQAGAPAKRLLVATISGIAILEREAQGSPWVHVGSTLTDCHIGSLLFEPVSGRLIAGAHENGYVWISDDGRGKSWRQVKQGLSRPHVYALAQRNVGGKVTLFAGTQPAGLYRSDDCGDTWSELPAMLAVPDTDKWTFPGPPHLPHVKAFTIHPVDPRTYFVLIEQGALLRTVDDGQTFVELSSYSKPGELAYRDLHRLLINPDKPSEMYMATGEGLYRTDDAGTSWTHLMKRGETIGYPDDLFFDPADHNILFMAGTVKSPNEWLRTSRADPKILKSTDRGATWREIQNGISQPVEVSYEAMSQHTWQGPQGRGQMLALASAAGHLWTSEDGGESWAELATQLAPVAKDHHFLFFLPPDKKQSWMARRMERTGFGPPGAMPRTQ